MAGIRFKRFGGEAPRVPPRDLEPHLAQTAQNCDLRNGNLVPLKGGAFEWTPTKLGTIKSIYLFADQYWFHWTDDVDVIRGPIAGDTSERTYYTGTEYPRVTDNSIGVQGGGTDYPTNSYQLGIPKPTAAISASLGTGGGCDDADKISAAFAYAYVSEWGEEGPLSDPTAVVDVCQSQTVTISGLAAPSGNYNIATYRIYCSTRGEFQFLADVAVGNTSYDYASFSEDDFGEVATSETWYPPPDDMQGLCMMANGIAVGFAGNEIIPSETWQPHAYPPQYRLVTDYPIVAIAAVGQGLVVATEGHPYLVSGAAPSALSMVKSESKQACVSKRSMVDMGDWAIWASPDGLVAAAPGGQPKVITAGLMKREQWQALKPSSIHAYYWEGKYVAFYDTGAEQGGFIFDPNVDNGIVFLDFYATAGHNDLENDALYLVVDGDIVEWNAGSNLTQTWKSRIEEVKQPRNYGWGQVKAESYPVTLKVYADGTLKHTQTVSSINPFRLPSGFMAEEWELEVTGTAPVYEVMIAESAEDMQRV